MVHLRLRLGTVALTLALAARTVALDAQTPPDQVPPAPQAPAPQVPAPPGAVAAQSFSDVVQRWFDVPTATFMARYRRVESSEGFVNANHMQDGFLLRARLKLDRRGRYALNGSWATG